MQDWLHGLRTHERYSEHTVKAYHRDLTRLIEYCPGQNPADISENDIRRALAQLHGQGFKPRSLARTLAAWRGFYQWWAPRVGLPANPAAGVRAPRQPQSLPRALSVEQAQVLLDRPGTAVDDDPVTIRDQAMFELFYSSGLRLAELVDLDHQYRRDSDYESGSWLQLDEKNAVVRGKGSKTRHVPVGGKAVVALKRWLDVRPQLAHKTDTDSRAALFLGVRGARIHPRVVQRQLQQQAQRAGLPVHVHPHSLRHSFASHLLQSSQDLRAVQELLGHANISTTQAYTRLDFQHLAQVYDRAHPRALRQPEPDRHDRPDAGEEPDQLKRSDS